MFLIYLKNFTKILIFFQIINFVYSQNENSEFPSVPSEDTTLNPSDLRTGKLNQFSGFFTPRPLPDNANFVYASIWASWSAWSFCVNNVQVRVRACNTVRGFTCPGPNQERKPCEQPSTQSFRPRFRPNNDYDAVDPWEEDRREALKQLYSDYTPPEIEKSTLPPRPIPNFGFKKHSNSTNDFKSAVIAQSAGKTVQEKIILPLPGNDNFPNQQNYGSPVSLPIHPSMNSYGSGVGAPVPPPRDENFKRRQLTDGRGEAPSMTPELLFGSKLEIPLKKIKTEVKEETDDNIEGIDSEINNSKEKENFNGLQKVVPSNETGESPLKIGLKSKKEKFEGDIFPEFETTTLAAIEKTDKGEIDPTIKVESGTAEPLTEELETLTHELENVTPKAEIVTPRLIKTSAKPNLETTNIKSFAIATETENRQPRVNPPKSTNPEDLEVDSEGQMYDDEIEKTTTIPTTKSPQETWKELEKNIEELEKETERDGNSKLHSGEVVFNADTERALNWLIANMTKATKLAMSETDENSAIPKANPMIDQDNEDRTVLHSGEVIHPKKEHSGERFKWNVAFSSKTKHLVPIKPTRIDGHKYDNAKMVKLFKVELTTETPIEKDLKYLKNEMQKMQNEIEKLEEEQQIRTTITPIPLKIQTINAMDFDVVPKTPKMESGSLPAVIGSGNGNGDVFMLDGVPEKTVAQWSNWRDWNECFCDKQVRTRICNYDSGFHSRGCVGKSFETRPCISTKPCPAKIAAANRLKLRTATTPRPFDTENGVYTLAPHIGPRTGYAFKPHPLSEAISRIQTFQ